MHPASLDHLVSSLTPCPSRKQRNFLRMHPVTLRVKAALGEAPGAKFGKRWVFLRIDLEALP